MLAFPPQMLIMYSQSVVGIACKSGSDKNLTMQQSLYHAAVMVPALHFGHFASPVAFVRVKVPSMQKPVEVHDRSVSGLLPAKPGTNSCTRMRT